VATIVAVADSRDLVQFRAVLELGSPMPRIFAAVGEENVSASSVEAALVDRGLLGLGQVGHVKATEHIGAVLGEVCLIDDGRPHGLFGAHGLEPSVLRAVLVSPRTAAAEWVDDDAGHGDTIVVYGARAALESILGKSVSDDLLVLTFKGFEHITQTAAVTVLDSPGDDISVVREPVVGSEVGHVGGGE